MQAADSWHYLAKQWLIVTDFPDGHSNNWRRAPNPAIRFHLAEDSTTAVFSFPTHSSRAFCCSSGLLSMQQIELQWAGKSSLDDALLSSSPSPSTLLCISLSYSCDFWWGKLLKCKCLFKAFAFKGVFWERIQAPHRSQSLCKLTKIQFTWFSLSLGWTGQFLQLQIALWKKKVHTAPMERPFLRNFIAGEVKPLPGKNSSDFKAKWARGSSEAETDWHRLCYKHRNWADIPWNCFGCSRIQTLSSVCLHFSRKPFLL